MYKKILGTCCLLAASLGMQAQSPLEKGLQSINQDKAEAIVEFLADDNLLGREAGQRESRIVARYLASELKEAGIRPLLRSRRAPWSGNRKGASRCTRTHWHG